VRDTWTQSFTVGESGWRLERFLLLWVYRYYYHVRGCETSNLQKLYCFSASLCLLSLVRGLLTFASSRFHRPSLYGVLVNFPVLHDNNKILRRVLNELDVRERVAVDQQ